MDQFFGKEYLLTTAENFEAFLHFMDTSFMVRKVAANLKSSHTLTKNDDGTYTFSFSSKVANSKITFKLGEEFDETKPSGGKAKTKITFEGNKMIQVSTSPEGTVVTSVYEFSPEELIETTTAVGFDKVVTKKYQLVK